ncbi:MAG: hypothetical protein A2Y04_05645 [Omnitrophica WOR_2 bacterium GWC2_45_7]|nr:MAG: hypothetical protein A2Y04_05645 [Omnitrophica WOR_2 bacterium GWC2_45_7]
MTGIALVLMILGLSAILFAFHTTVYKYIVKVILIGIFVCLTGHYFAFGWFQKRHLERIHRRLYYLIPLAGFFLQFGFYHIEKIHAENHAQGFWQLQRSWEDMQRYVQRATPVEAVLLVPYNMEMCGFRMFSERGLVVSYRDCGIVGFDYPAALEWQKRIRDVEPFKVNVTRSPHQAIKNAISKYKADYIVFLRYASPAKDNPFFQRIYTNRDFALFKVMVKPDASESF